MTYIPYAHIAAASSGVSVPSAFLIISREDLIAQFEAIGEAHVLAVSTDGRSKLAGLAEGVKTHYLSQVWKQGYGVIIPAVGTFDDIELFGMAYGRRT